MYKRILHSVAIMNRAGEETFLMNVFRNINREKVLFDFLCCLTEKGDYDDEIEALGGKVITYQLSEKKSFFKRLNNFFRLYNILKKIATNYSVFHIHTQHAMDAFLDASAAKLAGIPNVVVHSHSNNTLYHIKAHKIFRPMLRRLPITRFACSASAGMWLFGKRESFQIICNGIDVKRYGFDLEVRKKNREKFGWTDYSVIGHVGSFTYPKNHEFIIRIFEKIHLSNKKVRLVFVGEGELQREVREQVDKLGLNDFVQFMGVRDDIDILDQCFDLLLFPSRYEGLGIVLIEAQCTGLPCLISDTIIDEVNITPKASKLSLEDSAQVWAEKCVELLNDSSERSSFSEALTKSGYNIANVAQQLEHFYLNL